MATRYANQVGCPSLQAFDPTGPYEAFVSDYPGASMAITGYACLPPETALLVGDTSSPSSKPHAQLSDLGDGLW